MDILKLYAAFSPAALCRVQVWWPVPACPHSPITAGAAAPRLPGFAEHNGAEKAQSCWSKYIIVAGAINNKHRSDYNLVV